MTTLLALVVVQCGEDDPTPSALDSSPLPPMDQGAVQWLDPENQSTWSKTEKPYFLFLFDRRSYWSREMARDAFGSPENANEISRLTRPVWIDADLRPDLVDRYALGALPSLAVLTPDLEWITGSTYLGAEDMASLLRRIRILVDVPERAEDLERERAKLRMRRPHATTAFANRLALGELRLRLTDAILKAPAWLQPGEGVIALIETGNSDKARAWAEANLRPERFHGSGALYDATLTDDHRLTEERVSLAVNAGALYTVATLASLTDDRFLAEQSRKLAEAFELSFGTSTSELFGSGTADFSADTSGVIRPGAGAPSLYNRRSVTSWNALAVSAFCRTATLSAENPWPDRARSILDAILKRRVKGSRVRRTEVASSVLQFEDAAHTIRACLDLADLTGETSYKSRASELADRMLKDMLLEEGAVSHLIGADGHYGSGAGVFAQCLVRMAKLNGTYLKDAERLCRLAIAHDAERPSRLGAVVRALVMLEAKGTDRE